MKAFRYITVLILTLSTSLLTLLGQPLSITNVTSTPTTCSDGVDGTISFDITGGVAPFRWYIYEGGGFPVDAGGPTHTTSITSVGRRKYEFYLIAVVDSLDNPAYFTASVSGPDPMLITSSGSTDISCNDVNDGTISVTATGESGSPTYVLAGPASGSNSTGVFTGLPGGVYTVTATDAGGCPSNDITPPLTIINPALVSATLDNIIDAGCYGAFTGSVSITPTGGTPSGVGTGYTYAWTGPGTYSSTAEDIILVEAGDYFVTITDGNGCSSALGPYTVGQPTEIIPVLDASTDVSCNGGSDGTISITTSGGAGGYTYSWVGQMSGPVSTDEDPINLAADTYSLTVTDVSGCYRDFPAFVTITQPDPLAILVNLTTPVSCNGGSDGSAEITVTGGTAPYTFAWSGAMSPYTSTDEDPTAMPADVYSVSIVDDHGCIQAFPNVLAITEPPAIIMTVDGSTDVSCFGGSDGEILISPAGGTPPFTFVWLGTFTSHTSSAEDPDDLPADTYSLTITDGNSCVVSYPDIVIIGEPAQLDVTVDLVSQVDCNGDATGSIEITPSGGTPSYLFAWSGPNGFTDNTEDIAGLAAGDYSLTITDDHGCTRDFPDLVTITENPLITASFLITDQNCGMPLPSSDGAIDATIAGGIPGYTFDWTGPNGFTDNTEDISGLEPGDYILEVTDNLGCQVVMLPQTVGTPPPFTASTTQVDIACFGAGDGSIDLTVAGGTAPYTFAWTGPGGFTDNTEDISGLEAGAYSVTITYFNGCAVPFPDIATINESPEIQVASVKTDISCGGLTDGAIEITVSGGVPPYLFAWTGPNGFTSAAEDLSGLEAGNYSLTITDGNTCVVSFPGLETIIEPSSVVASYVSHVDILCNGDASGSIEIDVNGGLTPYLFDWTNGSGTSVSALEDPVGLPAGTYSLLVTDDNGCTFNFPDLAIIVEPPLLLADLAKTDISCFGSGDGTITVTAAGGSGPYDYSSDGIIYQPGNSFGPLSPGFYTIRTRDVNLCVVSDTITLQEPDEILIQSETSTYLCPGALQGEISINGVTGGVAPYTYSINGGTDFFATSLFNNLAPGSYQTVVMDATGCSVPGALNVLVEPPPLQISFYNQEDITSCSNSNEGRIIITGIGGTGTITYSLDGAPPVATGDFQNLPGGIYVVTLVDDNACTHDTTVEILAPTVLSIDNIIVTDVTPCNGDANGELEISGSGGTGQLEFSLDDLNYQTGTTFTGLAAGDYTVWLRDANGCSDTASTSLAEPAPVLATVTKTDATYGNLGTIAISNVSGGTAPYEYSINGLAGPFTAVTTYADLTPASYHVIVRDQNGCIYEEIVLILDAPPLDVLVNISHVSCFGASDGSIEFVPQDAEGAVLYSIDNGLNFVSDPLFAGLSGNLTYQLVALDEAGKLFVGSVSINEPTEILLSYTTTPANCNAFSETGAIDITVSGGSGTFDFLWSDDSTSEDRLNIVAGEYELLITDGNNCTLTDTITVDSDVTVTANAGEDVSICSGASIQLQGSGTGIPSWETASWLSDPSILDPVAAGMTESTAFVLTITETASIYGCYITDTMWVNLHPLTGLEVTPDTFIIKGQSIQLEATGGPFDQYRWEPETGLDNASIPNPLATPIEATTYYVYALNSYGCEEVASVFVDVIEDIQAYNVFSPNGDGINEYFEIRNSERFPQMLVEVYSRWGDQIFSTVGYGSGNEWDGTVRGKEAPLGTYYYIIVPYQGARPITGNVTIIR